MVQDINTLRPLAHRIPTACALLGLSRASVYRLVAAGKLDARKLGSRTVVTDASVTAFLASAPPAPIRQVMP